MDAAVPAVKAELFDPAGFADIVSQLEQAHAELHGFADRLHQLGQPTEPEAPTPVEAPDPQQVINCADKVLRSLLVAPNWEFVHPKAEVILKSRLEIADPVWHDTMAKLCEESGIVTRGENGIAVSLPELVKNAAENIVSGSAIRLFKAINAFDHETAEELSRDTPLFNYVPTAKPQPETTITRISDAKKPVKRPRLQATKETPTLPMRITKTDQQCEKLLAALVILPGASLESANATKIIRQFGLTPSEWTNVRIKLKAANIITTRQDQTTGRITGIDVNLDQLIEKQSQPYATDDLLALVKQAKSGEPFSEVDVRRHGKLLMLEETEAEYDDKEKSPSGKTYRFEFRVNDIPYRNHINGRAYDGSIAPEIRYAHAIGMSQEQRFVSDEAKTAFITRITNKGLPATNKNDKTTEPLDADAIQALAKHMQAQGYVSSADHETFGPEAYKLFKLKKKRPEQDPQPIQPNPASAPQPVLEPPVSQTNAYLFSAVSDEECVELEFVRATVIELAQKLGKTMMATMYRMEQGTLETHTMRVEQFEKYKKELATVMAQLIELKNTA